MITFLISVLKIVFLLGFLIFIHESGHMLVAKCCKVRVNEFAIGFGPTIFSKQGKETKYTLRLVPLGGFCNMEGEEQKSENEGSFSKASIPKRMAIILAGATVNIIFGLIVYFILMASTGNYVTNVINDTIEGYVAQEINLQQGDKILKIDDKKINNKYDLNKAIENNTGKEIKLVIERNGKEETYNIKPTEVKSKYTGMYIDEKCKIVSIDKNSPAEKQGILSNDKIIKINDEEINGDLNKAINQIQKESESLKLTLKRGKEDVTIELIPEYMSTYYLGVVLQEAEDTFINHIIYAGIETKEFTFSIIDNIKSLFTGKVGVDQMMGPVGISEAVAKTDGVKEFIYMLALISLSLGVTNLLPIPALDGGKFVIILIEAIRRKPMKQETEINIQLLGFSLLIALSLYITYHDVLRLF